MRNMGFQPGGLMSNVCEIEIVNWEKYQGESKKWINPTWFRIANDLYEHDLWFELNDAEFRAFYLILSRISKKFHITGKGKINLKTISRISGIKIPVLQCAIEKLEQLQVIRRIFEEKYKKLRK